MSDRPFLARNDLDLLQRGSHYAGIATAICNLTFRSTGITANLENRASLQKAQAVAAHGNRRTTKHYDGSSDRITLDASK